MKLRNLLYMNKSDRQVMLVLLSLAAIMLCAIYVTGEWADSAEADGEGRSDGTYGREGRRTGTGREERRSVWRERYSSGGDTATTSRERGRQTYYHVEGKRPERFDFDPNTADSTALLRLGLRPWQVRNIYKYRAAGGVYMSKEDFSGLYGLTAKEYRELEPYIHIGADYLPASTLFRRERAQRGTDGGAAADSSAEALRTAKIKEGETVDLCTADTAELKTVPGIGGYYARRIFDYGRRLGGYVSADQLDEIDGLPQRVKAYFTVSQPHTRKMAVNRLSLSELKQHPYMNFYQAKAITDYRRLHGPIKSLGELRLLPEFSEEAIARLEPYVTYE